MSYSSPSQSDIDDINLQYFNDNFPIWKNRVEEIILHRTGFRLDDLPDFPYAPNFESGTSVTEMSIIILNDLRETLISWGYLECDHNESSEP